MTIERVYYKLSSTGDIIINIVMKEDDEIEEPPSECTKKQLEERVSGNKKSW